MQTTPLILALVLDPVGPHKVLKVSSMAHEKSNQAFCHPVYFSVMFF